MKKYRISDPEWPKPEITEVEIEKESDNQVYIDGNTYWKIDSFYCFYDTREEAYKKLEKLAIRKISVIKLALANAVKNLKDIREIKNESN